MAKTWVNNVGVLRKTAKGPYLLLGNPKGKDEQYRTTVTLTVKDFKGNIITEEVNPLISLQDPRKRKGISEEQAASIPEELRYVLSIPPEKEK